ncbi:MAG: triphosphoribosyl-dephospho-CoA synthase [Clostridium sp.]
MITMMLFEAIRLTGIEAEKAMFAATDGVNTHKGMIFSMGTIAAAAGLFYRRHEHFEAEKS